MKKIFFKITLSFKDNIERSENLDGSVGTWESMEICQVKPGYFAFLSSSKNQHTISSLSLSSPVPRRYMWTTKGMYSTIISMSATWSGVANERYLQLSTNNRLYAKHDPTSMFNAENHKNEENVHRNSRQD